MRLSLTPPNGATSVVMIPSLIPTISDSRARPTRKVRAGNALGGVRLPDHAVPTGTNGGQNQPQSFTCMLVGTFSPFAATKAERERTADARLSIEERYRARDDYVNRIRTAALDLVTRGFMLPEDAAVIVQEAASSKLFAPAPANDAPR
jgi:hypothetical protein